MPLEFDRVLGIDQSLEHLGMASLDRSGAISTRRVDVGGRRGHARLQYLKETVRLAAEQHDLVAMERPIGASKAYQPELAGLFFMLKHVIVWDLALPLVLVYPSTRAKYSGAGGKASKLQVLRAVKAMYPEVTIGSDDEADAVLMALIGARVAGDPLDGDVGKDRFDPVNPLVVEWERQSGARK